MPSSGYCPRASVPVPLTSSEGRILHKTPRHPVMQLPHLPYSRSLSTTCLNKYLNLKFLPSSRQTDAVHTPGFTPEVCCSNKHEKKILIETCSPSRSTCSGHHGLPFPWQPRGGGDSTRQPSMGLPLP